MKNISVIVIFLFTIFFLGCSPKISPDKYWSEKRWVLTEMKGVPVQLSGTNRDAYLEFNWSDKRFTGNGGCNRLNGNYELDKSELRFREVSSTKMSCPDLAFETTFLGTLDDVDRFEMENDLLVLKDGRKTILIFRAK